MPTRPPARDRSCNTPARRATAVRAGDNGDGSLSAADANFAGFKVLVTNEDGSTTAKTLTELGITSLSLTPNAKAQGFADGTVITGEAQFTRADGTTGTMANTMLAAEAQGHVVTETISTDATGTRTDIVKFYGAGGALTASITTTSSSDGSSKTLSFDDDGDGVTDRRMEITQASNDNGRQLLCTA
jgi:hypothetical protein